MLGVMPSKLIKGCNTLQSDESLTYFQNNCQESLSLQDMLARQFRTDAHFTCYNLTDFPQWPLLNKSILPEIREEGHDIILAYMAFDWDNDNHSEWGREMLAEFGSRIDNCEDPIISAWSAIYTTKHGARIIYKMSHTVPVDEGEKHLAWMFNHYKENGFDRIDENCKDYTRRFRCPQVMRDDLPTWQQPYYFCEFRPDRLLDMNLIGKRSTKTIARKTYFIKEKQERPTYEQLESMLMSKDKSTGRYKQTEFYKRAKKTLKDSFYLDVLFNDASPDWRTGERNDQIVRLIGTITPILLKPTHASVQQIFALVIHPLLTLDNDQDWVSHGWNALLDIYEREVNKFNLEKEEVAAKVSKELVLLDGLVQGMKEWCTHPSLFKDEDAAREFVRANCMASVEKYLYLMDESGRYSDFAIQAAQVISRVRRTFLDDIIKTSKNNYLGEEVDISAATILNQYSTPVSEVLMKPVGGSGGYIENLNGEKPVLVLSTFSRNDDLVPTFNPFVNEWLKNLFGEHYETGCAWIGNALAFEEGLICALSMEGASSAGKKLFTEGLSECLKIPRIATPEAMYHQSSAFLHTPFLIVDETWPKITGTTSPADKFKSITGGDGVLVNEKFKPAVRVLCPVRLIMTANDDGIIRTLISGKDMGLDNRIAVGERLYHFRVSTRAKTYLESIGGRGFTAKKGQRWIRPDSGPDSTDYIVAKHFLWLYRNRDPVDATQRFLVMGNCAPGAGRTKQTILEKLLADNNNTPIVAQAIIEMTDCRQRIWLQYVKTNQSHTKLWVTRYGVHKYIKIVMEERVQESDVYSGMLNLLQEPNPAYFDDVHWYEISAATLSRIATERGIAQSFVRTIYMNSLKEKVVA